MPRCTLRIFSPILLLIGGISQSMSLPGTQSTVAKWSMEDRSFATNKVINAEDSYDFSPLNLVRCAYQARQRNDVEAAMQMLIAAPRQGDRSITNKTEFNLSLFSLRKIEQARANSASFVSANIGGYAKPHTFKKITYRQHNQARMEFHADQRTKAAVAICGSANSKQVEKQASLRRSIIRASSTLTTQPNGRELNQQRKESVSIVYAKKLPRKAKTARSISMIVDNADEFSRDPKTFFIAETFYKAALMHEPRNVDLWIKLAHMQAFQNKFSEADQSFLTAQVYQPQSLEALLGRFHLALWQSQYNAAARLLSQLQKLYPDNLEVARATIRLSQVQNKHKQAIQLIRRQLLKYPDDGQLHLALGDSQYALLQDKEARASFRQAATLQPDDPNIQKRLQNSGHKRWRLTLNGGYSQLPAPHRNWQEGGVSLSYQLSAATTVVGRISQYRRFGALDRNIELTAINNSHRQLWTYIAAAWTPAAKFYARYSLRGGVSKVSKRKFQNVSALTTSVDGKIDAYDNGYIKTAYLSLRAALYDEKFSLTLASSHTFDQHNNYNFGYGLSGDFALNSDVHLNSGFSRGKEPVGNVLLTTDAVFSGVKYNFDSNHTLTFTLTREVRNDYYNRNVYDLVFTRQF